MKKELFWREGESLRCLTVKDEGTRLCLAREVDRALSHERVSAVLKRLMGFYGQPRSMRSDDGSELIGHPQTTFSSGGRKSSKLGDGSEHL